MQVLKRDIKTYVLVLLTNSINILRNQKKQQQQTEVNKTQMFSAIEFKTCNGRYFTGLHVIVTILIKKKHCRKSTQVTSTKNILGEETL